MNINTPEFTVVEYLGQLERGEITVNTDYQRSEGVWPTAARSFLIETVLLNYPVPKLSLHQRTDIEALVAHKEVVDGQQRTYALRRFAANGFRLSNRLDTEELRGLKFNQLTDEYKQRFLNYQLTFDIFIGATDEEVREIFRRMNSFTTPLNPEEQRHAQFQGPFKWFIRELAKDYDAALINAGVFAERGILRMADAKLLSEVVYAIFHGITTTDKRKLEALYKSRDREFAEEEELNENLREALDTALSFEDLLGSSLYSKQHVFYALILACFHALFDAEELNDQLGPGGVEIDEAEALEGLNALAAALDENDEHGPYGGFVVASSEQTNVGTQREERVRWLLKALVGELE